MKDPIKVLLVEDSPIALEILQRLLQSSPEISVVGTASNGKEALEMIPKVQPNIICTDLHMKGMNGLELTQQVMAKFPRPILVISNSVHQKDADNIFKLLQAGAIDVFPKPITGMPSDYEQVKQKLINKLKVLAGVSVFTRRLPKSNNIAIAREEKSYLDKVTSKSPLAVDIDVASSIKIITIGASTGGPQALHKIFSKLPSNFPLPIICVQHISEGFLQGFVNWLDLECQLKVKVALEGESPLPGIVYFGRESHHLELNSLNKFTYTTSNPIDGHCPSITVMFQAIAKYYGKRTAGILLTGMGKDGVTGMRAIADVGGLTIAQDEKTSVVFGMPKEAIAFGAVKHVLPVQEIAPLLLNIVFGKNS
ncbi:chemotaxis-specific protein-glutamate methyltransferase CheB [Pleurocapsales cyanobacterium LEGE 06147]|nr:chemotaxis-specific protein-glutamate methyltransferase CheB [Pleurocapsales cyanobacterium LEGE 06147]